MDKNDRRVKRTQKLLTEALLSLAAEMGYEAVTIKDVTERADISYSTFFRHYADKDQLLLSICEDTVEALTELIQQNADHSTEREGLLLFEHVQANHLLYQIILNSRHILRPIQTMIVTTIIQRYTQAVNSVIPVEIAAHHMVTSILSLVRWWLEHEQPYPPERMGVIYSQLIIEATERAAQMRRQPGED